MTAAATSFLLRSPPSPLAPRDSGRPEAPSRGPGSLVRRSPCSSRPVDGPTSGSTNQSSSGARGRVESRPSSWSRRYFLDRKARFAAVRLDAVRPGHRPLTDARAYRRGGARSRVQATKEAPTFRAVATTRLRPAKGDPPLLCPYASRRRLSHSSSRNRVRTGSSTSRLTPFDYAWFRNMHSMGVFGRTRDTSSVHRTPGP